MTKIILQFILSVVVGCVMAGELPPEMQDFARNLRQTCLKETGVDESLIEPCKKGIFADDKKLHCYFHCNLIEMGAISDDGEIDAEVFSSLLPPELHNLLPDIKICSTVQGADACEMSLNFNKCLQKADPVGFIVI